MAKGWVYIDEDRCKGCGLCVASCAQEVLALSTKHFNAKGYRPAEYVDPEGKCTACTNCATMCPDLAITVYRSRRSGAARKLDTAHTHKKARSRVQGTSNQ